MVDDWPDPELLQWLTAVDMLGRGIAHVSSPGHALAERPTGASSWQQQGHAQQQQQQQQQPAAASPAAPGMADLLLVWTAADDAASSSRQAAAADYMRAYLADTCWVARPPDTPDSPAACRQPSVRFARCGCMAGPAGASASALQPLVAQVAAWPLRPWARPLSEVEWLAALEHVWSAVGRDMDVPSFMGMLLRERFVCAGGWKLRA